MTRIAEAGSVSTSEEAVRLRLDPHPSRATVLDGAWWPRSTDVAVELPNLVSALAGLRGQITHALLNSAEWDLPHHRRAANGSQPVRLGWYTAQPAGLLTIITEFGHDRFDLLVVPPDTSRASAEAALAAAADGADKRHAPELLADIEHDG
ncbi:hypothetical protein Ait01nite_017670 [Actinoplanes italicus]|uniref:Uncharacterized protein n=1 Tax=Actinoplanes italicus TaxID=113567 RepID=A0A2T0K072_9ACTN|nr:DUF5994 family protein [Actinoplanes italicus]PRX15922.1 hypothetical protein CLV67_122162 [Actinoplanes italicus]GIE28722.1 hypothetical protein Ait01nite_017670 [Actinoplanes italicus]